MSDPNSISDKYKLTYVNWHKTKYIVNDLLQSDPLVNKLIENIVF